MRRITIVLSVLLLAVLLLTACGGEEKNERKNTAVPASPLPGTSATSTSMATETPAATQAPTTGTPGTPGIPVTGAENPARLSKELDFPVLDKNGNEIGKVSDMVLDFDRSRVAYVVVGTGGFLGIGEKKILIPWNSLKLQTEANGGQKNAFVLQTDANALKNAPDYDLNNLPPLGQSAGNWDAQISSFWKTGGKTTATNATNTPAANATATAAPKQTATPMAGPVPLKGVVLASKVLGSKVTLGTQTGANGTGTAKATATTAANAATATPGTAAGAATSTATTAGNNVSVTIKDMIMDMKAGKVQFIVADASFDDGEHWIPIPANKFQWDASTEAFVLKTDAAALQKAPSFQEDQFPNTATSGWDSEFNKFWRNK